ncbi:MAG: hypothetical protein JWN04_4494 [Myxococcaceae bacterium]|nr:hypothetical protein [Myxococcaceae bacterium]
MARATNKTETIKVTLKWEDERRQWIATGTATGANGGKRLQAPGPSTTKAMHRLTTMIEEVQQGPFEIEPDVHVPAKRQRHFDEFVKRYKLWKAESEWIVTNRMELALAFVNEYQMPQRTVAPMLGMSPARLGKLISDHELGITRQPRGRPSKEGFDDDE